MADDIPTNPDDLPIIETAVPCRHLRSKGMYVYTDDADSSHDPSSSIYWCLKSMKNYGPDDDHVDHDSCCSESRSCYQPM